MLPWALCPCTEVKNRWKSEENACWIAKKVGCSGHFLICSCLLPHPSYSSPFWEGCISTNFISQTPFPSRFLVSFGPREVLAKRLECVKKAESFFFLILLMMSLVAVGIHDGCHQLQTSAAWHRGFPQWLLSAVSHQKCHSGQQWTPLPLEVSTEYSEKFPKSQCTSISNGNAQQWHAEWCLQPSGALHQLFFFYSFTPMELWLSAITSFWII